MCDYCDCRSRAPLASFSRDHERIGDLSLEIKRALLAEQPASASLHELIDLLERHGMTEEAGLYSELRRIGIEVGRLEEEHRRIHEALRSNGIEQVLAALEELHAHIHHEEYDLFPAAHQLLDDTAWDRVAAAGGSASSERA